MIKKRDVYRPNVLTRHPTHYPLRKLLEVLPFRSVIRLGSTTEVVGNRIQINTVQGVRNSASKLLMKHCFTKAGVKTAKWFVANSTIEFDQEQGQCEASRFGIDKITFPVIAKSLFGSRGIGNTKLDTKEQLERWITGKNLNNYIFEEFVKMTREYRLHITEDGCFYTCRKLLKNTAPDGTWQRHDDVCNWIVEENPSFKKPKNWDLIVADCVKAQKALGLDICAFDVMTQGAKDGKERENPEWIICESCSAPSFGKITLEKYLEQLPKLLVKKWESGQKQSKNILID